MYGDGCLWIYFCRQSELYCESRCELSCIRQVEEHGDRRLELCGDRQHEVCCDRTVPTNDSQISQSTSMSLTACFRSKYEWLLLKYNGPGHKLAVFLDQFTARTPGCWTVELAAGFIPICKQRGVQQQWSGLPCRCVLVTQCSQNYSSCISLEHPDRFLVKNHI